MRLPWSRGQKKCSPHSVKNTNKLPCKSCVHVRTRCVSAVPSAAVYRRTTVRVLLFNDAICVCRSCPPSPALRSMTTFTFERTRSPFKPARRHDPGRATPRGPKCRCSVALLLLIFIIHRSYIPYPQREREKESACHHVPVDSTRGSALLALMIVRTLTLAGGQVRTVTRARAKPAAGAREGERESGGERGVQ